MVLSMGDPSAHMFPEFRQMLDQGEYDDVTELCNQLGLNYDEVYDTDAMDQDEDG